MMLHHQKHSLSLLIKELLKWRLINRFCVSSKEYQNNRVCSRIREAKNVNGM
jgi:hypothetical protein